MRDQIWVYIYIYMPMVPNAKLNTITGPFLKKWESVSKVLVNYRPSFFLKSCCLNIDLAL